MCNYEIVEELEDLLDDAEIDNAILCEENNNLKDLLIAALLELNESKDLRIEELEDFIMDEVLEEDLDICDCCGEYLH